MMEFMQAFLTQASELACVEGADGTHRVLTCASRLLRHITRAGLAPLEDEMECLADYLSIRTARFGNRFHLRPFYGDGLFIERSLIISFIDGRISTEGLLNDPDMEYRVCCEGRINDTEGTVLRVRVCEYGEHVEESFRDFPL